jgi:MYXO-CTERM domain-containing protein
MRIRTTTFVALILAVTHTAGASEIVLSVSDYGELPVEFGTTPYTLTGNVRVRDDGGVLDFRDGELTLTSGSLQQRGVEPDGSAATYTYGPGSLEISGWWYPYAGGPEVFGRFLAPVDVIVVTTCEGCDHDFGGALADDQEVTFGPGTFDEAVARALGISTSSPGGTLRIGLEDIDGTPTSRTRRGFSQSGDAVVRFDVTPAPVPEPGVLALAMVAAAVMRRRRR